MCLHHDKEGPLLPIELNPTKHLQRYRIRIMRVICVHIHAHARTCKCLCAHTVCLSVTSKAYPRSIHMVTTIVLPFAKLWFVCLHNLSFAPNFFLLRQKPNHANLLMYKIPLDSASIHHHGLMLSLLLHMLVGPRICELEALRKSQVGVGLVSEQMLPFWRSWPCSQGHFSPSDTLSKWKSQLQLLSPLLLQSKSQEYKVFTRGLSR